MSGTKQVSKTDIVETADFLKTWYGAAQEGELISQDEIDTILELVGHTEHLFEQVNTLQHEVAVYKKALESSTNSLIVASDQVNTLTEALEWYADYDNYSERTARDGYSVMLDLGERARTTIQSIKEQQP